MTETTAKQPGFNFSEINWLKAIGVLLLQLVICVCGLYIYAIMSWLVFGESADSLMNSSGNEFVWIAAPISFVTIFNIRRITKNRKRHDIKAANTFIFTATSLVIGYCVIAIFALTNK